MTILFVQGQSASLGNAQPSISITFGGPVRQNDTLLLMAAATSVASFTWAFSDDQGNPYTTVDSFYGNTQGYATAYLRNIVNNPQTIVATPVGVATVDRPNFIVDEYFGLSALVGHSFSQQTTLLPGTDAVTSGTATAPPGVLAWGCAFVTTRGSSTIAAGTGYLSRDSLSQTGMSEEQINPTPGLVAATFTNGSTNTFGTGLLLMMATPNIVFEVVY